MRDKPTWCTHEDCVFIRNSQEMLCCGRLPFPESHGVDYNTHRLCINTQETGHGIFDLQVNNTDVYWLMMTLGAIKKNIDFNVIDEFYETE